MIKLLADWGISRDWWRGLRGEYWVIAQGCLMLGFPFLPIIRPSFIAGYPSVALYGSWGLTVVFGLGAIVLLGRSLTDLGQNLTPLPHPKDDGQLVQTGVYGIVRHPIYSGVIALALAYASWQMSETHLLGAIALFLFFDTKARQEETWLLEKFPDYTSYQASVKKLIPRIY